MISFIELPFLVGGKESAKSKRPKILFCVSCAFLRRFLVFYPAAFSLAPKMMLKCCMKREFMQMEKSKPHWEAGEIDCTRKEGNSREESQKAQKHQL
jgi:hypothetical protein